MQLYILHINLLANYHLLKSRLFFTSTLEITFTTAIDVILEFEKSKFVRSGRRAYSFSYHIPSLIGINFLVWWLCRPEPSNQSVQNLKLNFFQVPFTLFFNPMILVPFLETTEYPKRGFHRISAPEN